MMVKNITLILFALRTGFFAALGLLAATPAFAFCGFYAGKADASLYNDASQVIFVRDGPRTVLSLLNNYQGALDEFVFVVPTPVALKPGQVHVASKDIFARLDAFSTPRLAEYFDSNPCELQFDWGQPRPEMMMRAMAAPSPMAAMGDGGARAKALGVTVEASFTLGEYDIVSLSAKQSDGLETWLRENGYRLPKGASAALAPYIAQGMKFFAAKVNLKEQKRLGATYLRPLQFAYESEKFMLPMRLGMLNAAPGKAQDLIIYALTPKGRVESSNYRTLSLASDINLPPAIKPQFADVYKAQFAKAVEESGYRGVFTEYAWNMAWCDPCADKPLTAPELRQAGVFWLGGNPDEEFRILGQSTQSPLSTTAAATPADGEPSNKRAAAVTRIAPPMPPPGAGTQQVMITRLHLRYTPESLAEDPMFVETRNQGNKQVRHILQQPWGGSVQSCNADLQAQNCETVCKPRVQGFLTPERRVIPGTNLSFNVDEQSLMADCKRACHVGKQEAQRRTQEYYGQILPKRRENEMANLMQLTGWSATEAERFVQRASPQQDRAKRDKTPSRGAANAAQRDATAPAASPSNVDTKPWWASLLGWR